MRLVPALVCLLLLAPLLAWGDGLTNAPVRGELTSLFLKVCDEAGYETSLTTLPLTRLEIARHVLAMEQVPLTRSLLRTDAGFRRRFAKLRAWVIAEIKYIEKGEHNGRVDFAAHLYELRLDGRYLTQAGPTLDPWPRNEQRTWDNALGAAMSLGVERHLTLTIEPAFAHHTRAGRRSPFDRDDDWVVAGELRRGYLTAAVGNFFAEVGRDDFRWGPGRFGNLLLTDNAGPLDSARLGNREPFALPGPLVWLGRWRINAMAAMLEEDREYPHAYLAGLRAGTLLFGLLEINAARTVQFLGEGRPALDGEDIGNIVIGRREHEYAASDTNQLAQFDVRLSLGKWRGCWDAWLPLRDLEFWWEMGADSIMGVVPSNVALLTGAALDFGPVDFTYEYVNTQAHSPWYEHYIYTDGYTYNEEIIGHEVGCCTKRHTGRVRLWAPGDWRWEVRGDAADKRFRQVETEMAGGAGLIAYDAVHWTLAAEGGVWLVEATDHVAGMPDFESTVSWGKLSLAWRP